jgi:hypothetical protein
LSDPVQPILVGGSGDLLPYVGFERDPDLDPWDHSRRRLGLRMATGAQHRERDDRAIPHLQATKPRHIPPNFMVKSST